MPKPKPKPKSKLKSPHSQWPSYSKEEAVAVSKVLLSNQVNYWTGSQGREFEREFAAFCGTSYAIALANGTVALDLALKALNIKPGDEVIVTARTFIASVSCIVNAGATPVFVDVDADSQNITAASIAPAITPNTRAIICVHLSGWPCEMAPIMQLAQQHNLWVVEDCAQAHGAEYHGQPVGSIGHIGCWSFCQDKIMTTGGEGGMVTTNDKQLWSAMWSYKDHGKSWQAVYEKEHPPGFKWLHESFGTNWRMTEMQAAIGRIQLQKMPNWHRARRAHAQQILAACNDSQGILSAPTPPAHCEHGWYKCYAFVQIEALGAQWSRDRIIQELSARGVSCSIGGCAEVYLEKAFAQCAFRPAQRLPVARQLGESSIMFEVHPTLTPGEVRHVCQSISAVCGLIEPMNSSLSHHA